jgi:hypothetical protein
VAEIGGIGWLSTTFDGRFLAFIDYEHGPRNLGGHRIAEAVVFDTTTGRQLVRDATGNGSRSGTEDLSDLYAESTRPSWDSTTTRATPRPRRAAPSPGGTWRTGTAATWGTTNTRSPRTDQAARSSTSTSCTVCRARRPRRKPVQLAVGGRQFVLAGWLDANRFYGLAVDETKRSTAQVMCVW